jgi:hypothetical protein
LVDGHVGEYNWSFIKNEVSRVDGDQGVGWNIPPGKEAVSVGQVVQCRLLNVTETSEAGFSLTSAEASFLKRSWRLRK